MLKLEFDTDEGIGTRANLGMIVLETDETLESEFARMADLDGVARYHSRIPMVSEIRADTLARMLDDMPASAKLFPSSLAFDVIGYGCTSASTVIGSDKVAAAIQSVRPEAKVTDPLAALIAAGTSLGVKNLGFITPYIPDVSLKMREKLEHAGFTITAGGSFEEGDDRVVARISERAIHDAALRVAKTSDIPLRCPCDCLHQSALPEGHSACSRPSWASRFCPATPPLCGTCCVWPGSPTKGPRSAACSARNYPPDARTAESCRPGVSGGASPGDGLGFGSLGMIVLLTRNLGLRMLSFVPLWRRMCVPVALAFFGQSAWALDTVQITVLGTDGGLENAIKAASLVQTAKDDGETDPRDVMAAALAEYGRLTEVLYANGYYGGVIRIRVDGREAGRIPVFNLPAQINTIEITVDPGAPFTFGTARVAPLAPGTRSARRVSHRRARGKHADSGGCGCRPSGMAAGRPPQGRSNTSKHHRRS